MMEENRIVLEENKTRSESIRFKLSSLTWSRGISNFYLEDIPYSFSTGLSFTDRLSDLISIFDNLTENAGEDKDRDLRLCEVGSGLGLFSKHVMDFMKSKYPDIYDRLSFLVTEYSTEMVDEFEEREVFESHVEKFSCRSMDLMNPDFTVQNCPHLFFLNYVVDAMPARHIEVEDGQIYEIRITTSIDESAVFVDHSTMPPECLDADGIADLLASDDYERQLILSRRISGVLKETYVRVPIEDLDDMGQDEYDDLVAFVGDMNLVKKIRFNYAFCLKSIFQQFFDQMPNHSGLVIYDFGYLDIDTCPKESKMVSSYGVTIFFSVYFNYLIRCANAIGFHPINICFNEGRSQLMVMAKSTQADQIEAQVKALFPNIGFEKEHKVVDHIKAIDRNDANYLTIIKENMATLSDLDKKSYYLLINIALICLEHDDPENTLFYIQQSLDTYGKVGVPTYLLMGQAYALLEEYDKAEEAYLKTFDVCPDYPFVFYELFLLYGKQSRLEEILTLPTDYLNLFHQDVTWTTVLTHALIAMELGRKSESESIFEFILEVYRQKLVHLPDDIVKKVQIIEKEFLQST